IHRGLSRPRRRSVRRRRGAEGRVRRLSHRRRYQQAVPLQDPRARLSASPGDGLPIARPHACGHYRYPRLARHRIRGDRPVKLRLSTVCGLFLGCGLAGVAAAADKITVQSLVSDGYTVTSAWMSPIGPALVLQKADKVFLCFATERSDAAEIVTNYCK